MMLCKRTAFLMAALFVTVGLRAQTLLKTLNNWNERYLQEQLYVHFDKSGYNAGETVWFKAYIQSASEPSPLSTSVITEWRNERGQLLERKVFPAFESTAAGQFELPDNVSGRYLFFRAYTPWMQANDSTDVYDAVLPLSASIQGAPAPAGSGTQLEFHPEGGLLLSGFPTSIAISATGPGGAPALLSGTIRDDKGKTVANFRTGAGGLGKCSLEPAPGATYTAEWHDDKGTLHHTVLPAVTSEGARLQVLPGRKDITFVVQRSDGGPRRVQVLGLLHQQLVYRATLNMDGLSVTSGSIKGAQLASGVLQLALFDENWKPLSERAVYVEGETETFPVNIRVITRNTAPRGHNVLEIEVPDTLRASLSMAVTDADLAPGEAHIGSLLLADGIRTSLPFARPYFYGSSDSLAQLRDLLLLTGAGRHPSWESLAAGRLPAIPALTPYLPLEGKVYGLSPQQLAAGLQLNLVVQAGSAPPQLFTAPVDKAGSFSIPGLLFFDTATVYYNFNKNPRLDGIATVRFTQPLAAFPLSSLPVPLAPPLQPDPRTIFFAGKGTDYRSHYNRQRDELENVTVRGKSRSREQQLEKDLVSGLFQSNSGRNFVLENDPAAQSGMNLLDYLRGRVAGLVIIPGGTGYSITRRGSNVALFLDEMQTDAEQLTSIPMSEMAYVKVIDPPFIGAAGGGAGGAIVVYTKRGGGRVTTGKGLEKGKVIGYAPVRNFPDPPAAGEPGAALEDVRSTLLWKPYLLTGKGRQVLRVEFNNNDVSRSYRIIVEGVNEQGRVAHVEQVIR
jgi:hypothetical protein